MAVALTPGRSQQQRLEALVVANRIRVARGQDKRDLKAGRLSPVDILTSPPDQWRNARVTELLLTLPRWGQARISRTLVGCNVSPAKTVGGLSARQRRELIGRLSDVQQ